MLHTCFSWSYVATVAMCLLRAISLPATLFCKNGNWYTNYNSKNLFIIFSESSLFIFNGGL